jgi:hypothetical protein
LDASIASVSKPKGPDGTDLPAVYPDRSVNSRHLVPLRRLRNSHSMPCADKLAGALKLKRDNAGARADSRQCKMFIKAEACQGNT